MLPRDAAKRLLSTESLVSTSSYQCVDMPSDWAVSPAYAIGWDSNKKLYIGVAEYGADQQGPCYGGVILPKPVDDIDWIALVVDVKKAGYKDWRREVWELRWNTDKSAYDIANEYVAPAILRFEDEDGNTILSIPLGIPPLAIIAIAIVGTATAAALYKFFSWRESVAKKETIEYLAQLCESDPGACHAAVAAAAADNAISETNGFLGDLKNYVVGGVAGIAAILMLLFKFELLKSILDIFKRR
jgi:hypothetical protein